MTPRLGIDLGGTKIEIVALGARDARGDDGEVLRRRIATPRADYRATLAAIAALVGGAEAALGAGHAGKCTVGVGMPGSISPTTGLVRNGNSTWLNGTPLRSDLERLLGRAVRVANDANCFALSEAADGAAAGAASAFGVILGTGVGGGLVVAGRVVTGANAIAGEWGHVPLPGRGAGDGPPRPCWCGRTDCIETFLSGPALEREYEVADGARLAAAEIAARAAAGDEHAAAVLGRYTARLARALAMILDVFDPEIVVIGGGLSNIAALFRDVPRLWTEHVFSDHVATRLVPPRHGDSSGVRGAARLWGPGEAN